MDDKDWNEIVDFLKFNKVPEQIHGALRRNFKYKVKGYQIRLMEFADGNHIKLIKLRRKTRDAVVPQRSEMLELFRRYIFFILTF